MKTMKAVIYEDVGKFSVKQVPVPKVEKGTDLLLRVDACSICGTDVHILSTPPGVDAKKGIVLGHEMAGTIVDKGSDVKGYNIGDRVVIDNNVPCGHCEECQTGHYNTCLNMNGKGVDDDGVFAQYCVFPASCATKVPESLPDDLAVFCEPVNCCMGGIKKLGTMLPGQTAVVLGGGPIGLYYMKLLQLKGAGKVIVSEVSDYRKKYAEDMGAYKVVNPLKEDLAEYVKKETNGYGADIVIDAVGTLLNDALACVRPSGTILLFGLNGNAKQTICQSDIAMNNLTVQGSYIGHFTFEPTVKLLSSGIVDFRNMITHRLTLDDFGVGLDAMRKGEALEVVLYPNKESVD